MAQRSTPPLQGPLRHPSASLRGSAVAAGERSPRDGGQSPETHSVWALGWARARLSCLPARQRSRGRRPSANGEHDSARKRSAVPVLSSARAAADYLGEQAAD